MHCIRNIRWIDLKPGARLAPTPQEGDEMKGQKGFALAATFSHSLQLAQPWRRLGRQLKRWWQLAEQRRQLAQLGYEQLKDIGLSRADALQEAERPFWDDPLSD
jgi:uncharacterized protein YjiS (DUF1127 family)